MEKTSEKVTEIVQEIRGKLKQVSSSQKDEVRVMRAMLNDTSYEVDVYPPNENGEKTTYNPAKDVRGMVAGIISSTTKMATAEANAIMDDYEFKRGEAETMINVSKEFINTYIQTGRKCYLGGREKSNVALSLKQVPERERMTPRQVGIAEDNTKIIEYTAKKVNAHESVRVHGSCPPWVEK